MQDAVHGVLAETGKNVRTRPHAQFFVSQYSNESSTKIKEQVDKNNQKKYENG